MKQKNRQQSRSSRGPHGKAASKLRELFWWCIRFPKNDGCVIAQEVREEGQAALSACQEISRRLGSECPHYKRMVEATRRITSCVKEGFRRTIEIRSGKTSSWLRLAVKAKASATGISQIISSLPGAQDAFTEFLRKLVAGIEIEIQRVRSAGHMLGNSIEAFGAPIHMSLQSSRALFMRNRGMWVDKAVSGVGIHLPLTPIFVILNGSH